MINTSETDATSKFVDKFNQFLDSKVFIKDMENILGVERANVKKYNLTTHNQILKNVYDDNKYANPYFVYNFNKNHIYIKTGDSSYDEMKILSRRFVYCNDLSTNWLKNVKLVDYKKKDLKLIALIKTYFQNQINNKQSEFYNDFLKGDNSNNIELEYKYWGYATFSIKEFIKMFNVDDVEKLSSEFNYMNNFSNDLLQVILNDVENNKEVLTIINSICDVNFTYENKFTNFELRNNESFTLLINAMIKHNYLSENLIILLLNDAFSRNGLNDFFDQCKNYKLLLDLFNYFEADINVVLQNAFTKQVKEFCTKRAFRYILEFDQYADNYLEKNNLLNIFKTTATFENFNHVYPKEAYSDLIEYYILLVKADKLSFDSSLEGEKAYEAISLIKSYYKYSNRKHLIDKLLELV